jgi:hypothetical protein
VLQLLLKRRAGHTRRVSLERPTHAVRLPPPPEKVSKYSKQGR